MAELQLSQHVKWREQYVSAALNKKFSGVTTPGVYHGFELSPGGGMNIMISPGDDFPESVAVIERGGYSITVQAQDAGTVAATGNGTMYVCLEAYYAGNDSGYQHVVLRPTPETHHVVLGVVVIPDGATQIEADYLSYDSRMIGDPAMGVMQFEGMLISLTEVLIGLSARSANIETWAAQNGYDKDNLY